MERPKRPLSGYMIWLNENRESIKAENPGIKVTEVAKRGGELWRALGDKSVSFKQLEIDPTLIQHLIIVLNGRFCVVFRNGIAKPLRPRNATPSSWPHSRQTADRPTHLLARNAERPARRRPRRRAKRPAPTMNQQTKATRVFTKNQHPQQQNKTKNNCQHMYLH